jgi:hypothetical protein
LTRILDIASRFRGGPSAIALTCPEILYEDAAILCVVRKGGVWQFLCGRDHSSGDVWEDDRGSDPRITTVAEMVARDPSVVAVATMNDRHILRRESVEAPWVPEDDLSMWWV